MCRILITQMKNLNQWPMYMRWMRRAAIETYEQAWPPMLHFRNGQCSSNCREDNTWWLRTHRTGMKCPREEKSFLRNVEPSPHQPRSGQVDCYWLRPLSHPHWICASNSTPIKSSPDKRTRLGKNVFKYESSFFKNKTKQVLFHSSSNATVDEFSMCNWAWES